MSRGPDSEDEPSGDPTDVALGLPPAAGADDGRRRRQTPSNIAASGRAAGEHEHGDGTAQKLEAGRGEEHNHAADEHDHHELGSRRGEGSGRETASEVSPASSGTGSPDISQEHSFVSPTHTRHGAHPDARDTVHRDDAGHPHEHDDHGHGLLAWLREALPFGHGHSHGEASVDSALEGSERGIWALKVSLVGLMLTASFQVIVVVFTGSVALLADTIHNFSDALTALPLWLAFVLGRRPPSRRYTYGYGRAEDVAGVIIVVMILLSALVAAYESYQRIVNPTPLRYVWAVIGASLIGFAGNEAVALFRMRIGREIGSAALVADGRHAQVDGLTSLAVLIGALGVAAGYPLADPIIGLVITVAILFVVRDTARLMWGRLMDSVDPEIVDGIERTASGVAGAQEIHGVRVRWLGHNLQAELHLTVDGALSTYESHEIVEQVRHALFHDQPRLSVINIHVDPRPDGDVDPHAQTVHHEQPSA